MSMPITVDLFDPRTYLSGLPHEAFATLRRECPVYWQEEREMLGWPAGKGYWAITRHADVGFANRNPRIFSSNLGATQIRDPKDADLAFQRRMMLNMDPPEHTRLRRIVAKAFTPRNVDKLAEGIRARVRAAIEEVAPRGECDFPQELSADLPLLTLAEVMGVPAADRHLLFNWANRVIGFQDPKYARYDADGKPIDPRSRAALQDMFDYANALADEKRARPTDDILTTLLHADLDGERISDEEYENFFFLFAVAGNETVRNAIPGGMLALMEHPAERDRLIADPALLPRAIDEILRYVSPVMSFRRTATEDVELHGVKIAAGDKVVLYYASANFDETVFTEPRRFDVAREPNEHFSFGEGSHFCIGAHLARLQMRIFFEEVLRSLPDMRLAGPIERLQSNFQSGIKHMPVEFTAR